MDTPDNKEKTPNSEVEESQVREARPSYNKRYTYADYLTWDDDERWELIDGVPYIMAGPSLQHQGVLGNLFFQLKLFLKGKPCKVFVAPLDVRLNADTLDNTVVQPDVLVICDKSMLSYNYGVGVPDLVVEILSPSTAHYDRTTKFNAYLKAGVREFWVIDPITKTLAVHILSAGDYVTHAYTGEDVVKVSVLENCVIDLAEVFEE